MTPTLTEQVNSAPSAFRDRVNDWAALEYDVEDQEMDWTEARGTEYHGGEWFVRQAEVWLWNEEKDDVCETVLVNRDVLIELVGHDAVEAADQCKTEREA